MSKTKRRQLLMAVLAASVAGGTLASSHREAPFITTRPKVDGTDFYMFNSYEAGRAGFVTLIANYLPLQDPQGGPNYFFLDDNALYEISIDNTGSGVADLTFQFRFTTTTQGLSVMAGTKSIPVPLINIGAVSASSTSAQNVAQTYTLTMVKGDRRTGTVMPITNATTGATTFAKPLDNIGAKSIADYPTYAASFIYPITIPGCTSPGKVFVGQRQDGFVVNLGETFDLVNVKYPATQLAPAGVNGRNYVPDSLSGYNVTSLALEIPASCLTNGSNPVIGAYTTASLRQAEVLNPVPQSAKSVASVGAVSSPTGTELAGGAWLQVSRLGMPLVNELNPQAEILWFNRTAARLLGLRGKGDIGLRIENLVRSPEFVRYLRGGQYALPVILRSTVGVEQYLSMQIVPYGAGQLLALVRDVTRQARLEAMRTDFAANASHELRSPLTVISGYLETLSQDPSIDPAIAGPLQEMRRQSLRMTGILQDLLELSRLEASDRAAPTEPIDVVALMAQLRRDVLARSVHPEQVLVRADSNFKLLGEDELIHSAFANLVDNRS